MEDVLNGICDKLVKRHPHIYGDVEAQDEETVKNNWEKIKIKENGNRSVLEGVPTSLPALVKAIRIQDKAKGIGFEWDNKEQVWEKVREEMEEFSHEENPQKSEQEFGDVLFSLVNYARFVHINPEDALEKTNRKFIRRFKWMESAILKEGKDLTKLTLNEMNNYWNRAKAQESH